MKIINVVGARPNFMKMAPIIEAMNHYPERFDHLLVHTGQALRCEDEQGFLMI
jgi:UDP-N-acetylglucosamine 2-epimerase (non-hydrolysing)